MFEYSAILLNLICRKRFWYYSEGIFPQGEFAGEIYLGVMRTVRNVLLVCFDNVCGEFARNALYFFAEIYFT